MAVHLINTREPQKVRGETVQTGAAIKIDDEKLAAFMIRRRGFKRQEEKAVTNVSSKDNK